MLGAAAAVVVAVAARIPGMAVLAGVAGVRGAAVAGARVAEPGAAGPAGPPGSPRGGGRGGADDLACFEGEVDGKGLAGRLLPDDRSGAFARAPAGGSVYSASAEARAVNTVARLAVSYLMIWRRSRIDSARGTVTARVARRVSSVWSCRPCTVARLAGYLASSASRSFRFLSAVTFAFSTLLTSSVALLIRPTPW
jgi:hypothetical protein